VNGVTYPNNSIVNITYIGNGSAALACTTTYTPCCTSANQETQWYFPNGSQVSNNSSLPYQRTRGQSPGRVNLNRNSESTITGIFHCDIFDANGTIRSLYVGIYNTTTGESCTYIEWYNWLFARTYLSVKTIQEFCVYCISLCHTWYKWKLNGVQEFPGKGTENWPFGILG